MLETDLSTPMMLPGLAERTGKYVTFDLGGQRFAVDVADVREILDCLDVAPMPNPTADCSGMIDNRGESIPVLSLADRLRLSSAISASDDTRIIIFELSFDDGERRPVGVIADRVLNVCEIVASEIEPPPRSGIQLGSGPSLTGLARVDGSLVFILDLPGCFGSMSDGAI